MGKTGLEQATVIKDDVRLLQKGGRAGSNSDVSPQELKGDEFRAQVQGGAPGCGTACAKAWRQDSLRRAGGHCGYLEKLGLAAATYKWRDRWRPDSPEVRSHINKLRRMVRGGKLLGSVK